MGDVQDAAAKTEAAAAQAGEDSEAVELREEQGERKKQKGMGMAPSNMLVVGLGGGSDAQVAFALAQVRRELAEKEEAGCLGGGVGEVVYATCKWASSRGLPEGAKVVTEGVFSVEPKDDLTFEYLNEKLPSGLPRWVGTTLMEATIPQTPHKFVNNAGEETSFTSPMVVELENPKGKAGWFGFTDEFVSRFVDQVAPENGFHTVVGVDTGGDVVGGMEDSRDRCMLEFLRAVVQEQEKRGLGSAKFELVINGLCVDGENYFWQMNRKMEQLVAAGAFVGRTELAMVRPHLEQVVHLMAPTKTPWIMLNALDKKLDAFPKDATLQDIEVVDDKVVEHASPCAGVDAFDNPVQDLVVLPARHHKLGNGDPVPQVVVPRLWATSLFSFDARQFAKLF
ncbi:Uncharacterized protein SCF082_LOCUS40731 [Durusdinium trenchii]|uniref:Uncharacterized protein n=1 Tax=Durusdinium trenchii TaxID=1381693 RepID=A0ABP0QCT8_9DINO